MKRYTNYCLLIAIIYCITSCSNKNYPAGSYQQAVVTADGDLGEWNRPLRFGSNGGQVQYNVTNDNENIYVSIETHDELIASKILRSGVEVYIDPSGGKNKKISLAFPLESTSMDHKGPGTRTGGNFKQSLIMQDTGFTITGFKNMSNRSYSINENSPVKVAIKTETGGGLGYESIIPLRYIFDNPEIQNKPGAPLSVGIVINAMKGNAENHNNQNNSSRPASGMHGGGGHGGGRGAGGNRSGNRSSNGETETNRISSADRASLYKEDSNWYKFKLAVKN